MKKLVLAVVVVALAAGAWYWFFGRSSSGAPQDVSYVTAKVERGEVVEGVQASGAVQPVLLVQVGTQISGVIDKLFVDFNSKVKADQTVALLDARRLAAQVAQDEALVSKATADLDRMKAVVQQSKADVERVKATLAQSKADVARVNALLTQAGQDLARQKELAEKKFVAQSDLDAAVANKGSLDAQLLSAQATVQQNEAQVASSEATVATNEAQIAVGEATIKQSQAQYEGDKIDLEYATIKSPIDGVVVSRNVDVGQTVAASLSAPTLFLIANDLTKIQVQASVPEADIGRIKEGQKARFEVDAYPDRSGPRAFEGVVSQVRLASTTVQNVVTYTVLVDASNPQGLLLPGMTANVTFEISRGPKDALVVPSTALRLAPSPDLVDDPEAPPARGDAAGAAAAQSAPADKSAESGGDHKKHGGGRRRAAFVYLATPQNRLHAVAVRVGVADDKRTVVEPVDPSALTEGSEVVTAVVREEEPTSTNPFAPPRMGGPRRGGR